MTPKAPTPQAQGIEYYLGGTGLPNKLAMLNQTFNPIEAIGQSMDAGGRLFSPGRSGWQRVEDTGNMLSGMAGVVAPTVAGARMGVPAANALAETMTGLSMTPQANALAGFAADESGALRLSSGQSLDDALRAKYPDIQLSVTGSPQRGYKVGKIVVPKDRRGGGVGTSVMRDLLDVADEQGATVSLTPSDDFGGSVPRLKEFYKRLGFMANKGKNADYSISEGMYRLPKEPATPSRPTSGTAAHPGGPLINIVRKYGIAGAAMLLGVSAADVKQAMAEPQKKPQPIAMGAQ